MIVTTVKPKGVKLPSKKPFGSFYEFGKEVLKESGYYSKYDLQRFDPDYYTEKYISKYYYKPRKRLTGYAIQTRGFLQEKKQFRYYKLNQEFRQSDYSRRRGRKQYRPDCYRDRYGNKCRCCRRRERFENISNMARNFNSGFRHDYGRRNYTI